uniref:Rhomboid protein Lonja_RBL14 n=1 Tax=Lonicera japonica TaxID=105884 RepID=A0A0A7E6Q5_LONJA|nr:rhomboid protein Lonja_RBL14 [Lonicera japonica]
MFNKIKAAIFCKEEEEENERGLSGGYYRMDRRGRGGGRVWRGMLPVLALHAVSEYSRLDRKPPVTAGLIAANTLVYLRPNFLHTIIPTIDEVCFNPYLILKYKDLKRFLLSPFYHMGEPHLVFNMMSLLWKGIQLETSMGAAEFASMIVALLGMSQGFTLLIAKSLLLFDYDTPYYRQYAVGFSGVLFAMKVVLDSQAEYSTAHGLMVPARYAAWLELLLIQVLVPGVSFIGHLGGILAGLLYVRLKSSSSGPGPLTMIVRGFIRVLGWPLRSARDFCRSQRGRVLGRGRVGGRETRSGAGGVWSCRVCTFDNSRWLSVCEMCGTSRDGDDGLSSVGFSAGHDLSLEELRRRRVQRFGR